MEKYKAFFLNASKELSSKEYFETFRQKKNADEKNDAVTNVEPNNIEYVKFVDLGK